MSDVANAASTFVGRTRRRWRRVAGRSLKPTREGRWLIGISLVAGFGAINTGNNLLFFGWGLVLSAILVSGILSEATLRSVKTFLLSSSESRVGSATPIALALQNPSRRLSAFGVEIAAVIDDGTIEHRALARHVLRLAPNANETVVARYIPARRGTHHLREFQARTRFPFGFFEKTRHFVVPVPTTILVFPRRVETGTLPDRILSRQGAMPLGAPGLGNEFFSLRPFKDGDDRRQIVWRRTALTGRPVVRETERVAAREVIVDVVIGPDDSDPIVEDIIATAASIAEDLLARDIATGLACAGAALPPQPGPRQRDAILTTLALLNRQSAHESPAAGRAARLVVARAGTRAQGAFVVEVEASS